MLRGNGLQGFCLDYLLKNRCFELIFMVNSRAKKMKPVLKPFDIKKLKAVRAGVDLHPIDTAEDLVTALVRLAERRRRMVR